MAKNIFKNSLFFAKTDKNHKIDYSAAPISGRKGRKMSSKFSV
jgi:hypothetical protein